MHAVHPSEYYRPFGFLDLPPEIRIQIEINLLVRPEPVGCQSTTFGKVTGWLPPTPYRRGAKTWHVHPEILCVCKTLYAEGRDILYGRNIFGIEISAPNATFLDAFHIDERLVQVPVQSIRNFDIVVKLQDYQDCRLTKDVVGTVSKILSKNLRLNSLTITIKSPLRSESASESSETESDSDSLQSESGSESLDRLKSYQILWPFACLLRKVQSVTINGIRSRYAKQLQEEMRGDKHPHQLDQQYDMYEKIVLGGVAVDLRALDECRQRWDSEGFSKCLKTSVRRVPEHLESTMRIWSRRSRKSDDASEILESLRTAWAEEIAIPGRRQRARSV